MPGLSQREETWLREFGRTLRHHPAFPKGANVNFYDPQSPREAVLKTFERGVEDFTYACGTGSGATALTMLLRAGEKTGSVALHNTGGDLVVDVQEDGGGYTLLLTGPTTLVAAGEILDEEI
jgi:diaminopimelate epimerase